MGKEDKKESFLNNLGRATRRGVRQCRKCGTLNGTRGYSCKNKSCDVIFKDAGEKKKLSTEACKISTGSDFQIFSVRVRDKGPDYRAFVQVMENNSHSFNNPFESNTTLGEQFSTNGRSSSLMGNSMDGSNSNQPSFSNTFDPLTDILLDNALSSTSNSQPQNERVAHCYVESCNKNRQTRPPRAFCSHVKAVTHCYKNSEPVMLKSSVLNSMNIPQTLKTEIWQLATATPGPLVQRVSKNIMVVKCQVDDLNPLGFLHFNFQSTKNLKDSYDCGKYFCSCRSFKASSGVKSIPSNNNSLKSSTTKSCVHFFACIVALASHASLASEFSQYIALVTGESKYARKLNQNGLIGIDDIASTVKIHVTDEGGNGEESAAAYIRVSETPSSGDDDNNTRERSFLILNDRSDPNCQVEVEVLQDESFLHALERHNEDSDNMDENDGSMRRNLEHKLELKLHSVDEMGLCSTTADSTQLTSSSISQSVSSKDCLSSAAIATSALLTLQDTPQKKNMPGKRPIAPMYNKQTRQTPASTLVENNPTFSFNEWLGVVNEKINHSLQYGQVGTLPPLTFNINKAFYDILDQRITYIGRKKVDVFDTILPHPDSPNQKLKIVTWRIHNVFHLEYLLSNSYVSLQTTRTFLLNRNGTYQPYEPLDPLAGSDSSTSSNQQAIRPQEFKTVLKVGGSNYPGTCKRSPFVIEWIPNILPLSRMGELKLKYEYEHVHNGKVLRNISFKDIASQLAQNKTKTTNKDRNVPILPNTMAVAPSGSSPTGIKAVNKNGLTPIAPKLTVMDEKTLIDMLNRDSIGDTDSYSSFLL